MRHVFILFFTTLLAGCASNKDVPSFSVGVDEMTAAIYKFRQSENNILFLFMVSAQGEIVRSKIVETKFPLMGNQTKRRLEYIHKRDKNYETSDVEFRQLFHAIKYSEEVIE